MVVRPGAVVRFETLQTLDHAQDIRHLAAKVLIRSKRQEACVNRPVQLTRLKVEAAITGAKLFDPRTNRETRFFVLQTGSSSGARKATEMHEIQVLSVPEASRIRPNFLHRHFSLEGNQPIDAKDRVIEITFAGSISEAPVLVELSKQEIAHYLGRIFKDSRREPSHLEHF